MHFLNRELFGKWRHNILLTGNAPGPNNGFVTAAGHWKEICKLHFLVWYLWLFSFSFSDPVFQHGASLVIIVFIIIIIILIIIHMSFVVYTEGTVIPFCTRSWYMELMQPRLIWSRWHIAAPWSTRHICTQSCQTPSPSPGDSSIVPFVLPRRPSVDTEQYTSLYQISTCYDIWQHILTN